LLILECTPFWHAACFVLNCRRFVDELEKLMQSKIVALLAPEGSLEATLLVRRADGQFALERIDARVASAARTANSYPGTKVFGSPNSEVYAA
jgi:hypothetical protein